MKFLGMSWICFLVEEKEPFYSQVKIILMIFSYTTGQEKNLEVPVCSFNNSPRRNKLLLRSVKMG